MLTAELDAAVSWPNGVILQGLVKLNYLADVDPWLVHLTFVVADVRDDLEVDRTTLMRTCGPTDLPATWCSAPEGSPLRVGFGQNFVRMRVTDPENGAWCDFDVKRKELRRFLSTSIDQADYEAEKAALNRYIEESLGELE